MSLHNWLQNRERGIKNTISINAKLYRSISLTTHDRSPTVNNDTGAIFDIDFSPDTKQMIGGCRTNAIIVHDTLNRKRIKLIKDAHNDSVKCVCFLDNTIFASCSYDRTINIWDMRNIKKKICTLTGHSEMVENLNYIKKDKTLITSGCDGRILTWNLNALTEKPPASRLYLQSNLIVRYSLSLDATKLIMFDSLGYIMVVHDLDILKHHIHLFGDYPRLYGVMHLGQLITGPPTKIMGNRSKTNIKNRLEFITDFPQGNITYPIDSMLIHPYSQCLLSRKIGYSAQTEWTCIHDLTENKMSIKQEKPKKLRYYFKEKAEFLKCYEQEPCFSSDGRIICSPRGEEIRLFGYTDNCDLYIPTINMESQSLVLINKINVFEDLAIVSKFIPHTCVLVTGCWNGRVNWYHSVF